MLEHDGVIVYGLNFTCQVEFFWQRAVELHNSFAGTAVKRLLRSTVEHVVSDPKNSGLMVSGQSPNQISE